MSGSGSAALRLLVAVLLLGALALAVLAWWAGRVTVRSGQRAIAECRQRYTAAKSVVDSGAVDMVYLPTYWERVAGQRASRTCGDLRLAGKLR